MGLLAVFESSPLAQLVILPDDPLFIVAAVSDAHSRVSGISRENVVGRGLFEVFPDNPENVDDNGARNLRTSLRRVISTREPDQLPLQRYDVERTEEQGGGYAERYWNALNTPVLGPEGDVEYILHSAEEVTEKVLAEQRAQRAATELEAVQRRVSQAEQAGRIGSFEWLIKETRVISTPELKALYGLPASNVVSGFDDWSKSLDTEDAERVVAEITRCMAAHQQECVYEFRARLPNGNTRWLRGQARLHYDSTGAPERMVGVNIDIDAQKRAEIRLRESEERLRAIFDGTYQHICLLAPDGTVLEANRACLDFAANTRDHVVGRAFRDAPWLAHTPGAPQRVDQAVNRAASGEFVRFEQTILNPPAAATTFDMSFHPVRSGNGEVTLIVLEGRNITEQKESKERLQHQWHVFDTALSHIPDHVYIFDLEGRFTYANRALLNFWQKPREQAIGKSAFDLEYPRDLAERLRRQIQQVIDTKLPVRDHTAFEVVTGDSRHYDYIFVPVCGVDGKVEAVAGSTRDITDRERMAKALAESEGKLRRVFAQVPVAIIVFRGPDFIVELANPNYQAMLPGRVLLGRPFADVVPELGQHVWDAFHKVVDTGEPFIATEWHIPYDADKDGTVEDHWFNVAYHPLRDFGSEVSGLIAVLTDVTAPVLARRELERVNRELEEYSFAVSHDLQEPMRMVNVFAHLMLKGINAEDPMLNRYAGYVGQGIRRMETLISDLLTFSRAVHMDDSSAGAADLSVSLSNALMVLGSRIEETGAVVTSGSLPTVRGDVEQLASVFQNLLANSLKYRKKELKPEIHIWAEPWADPKADGWLISVEDNGIGFEPQYSERIFGLFKRLHSEEYPGTGLGLAICRRIVTRCGGHMWAEGRLGEGAIFRFTLPDAKSHEVVRDPSS